MSRKNILFFLLSGGFLLSVLSAYIFFEIKNSSERNRIEERWIADSTRNALDSIRLHQDYTRRKNHLDSITKKVEDYEFNDEKIYDFVEEMPSFPGGEMALEKYIETSIIYPLEAKKEKVGGNVVVEFVINKNGTISNANLEKDIGGGCGNEALRIVSEMPFWNPGHHNGYPKRVRKSLIIPFVLPAPIFQTCNLCSGNGSINSLSNCSLCSGNGYSQCSFCSGQGNNTCSKCHGGGRLSCGKCGGDGYNNCRSCSGAGTKKCSRCNGYGDLNCGTCNAYGYRICGTCGGKGKVRNQWNVVHNCPHCRGYGKIGCPDCRGKKVFLCEKCRGKRNFKCSSCSGKGKFKCNYCSGKNTVKCNFCNGKGNKTCNQCSGYGRKNCGNCNGGGRINILVTCEQCNGQGKIEFFENPIELNQEYRNL